MREIISETRGANHAARGVVEISSRYRLFSVPPISQQRHGCVPRPTHHVPHTTHLSTQLSTGERHPGLIREHAAKRHTRPEIEQHDVARGETSIAAGSRLVMRIRGVRLKTDDRRMIGDETGAAERLHYARLYRRFANLGAPRQLAAAPAQCRSCDLCDRFGGPGVAFELARRP